MNYYSRSQIIEILKVGNEFLVALEEEQIVVRDAPEHIAGEYSDVMFERARVAANLVEELEINLPGVAVIVRMREQMAEQRRTIEAFLSNLPTASGDE